jgi:hypothetical protein
LCRRLPVRHRYFNLSQQAHDSCYALEDLSYRGNASICYGSLLFRSAFRPPSFARGLSLVKRLFGAEQTKEEVGCDR